MTAGRDGDVFLLPVDLTADGSWLQHVIHEDFQEITKSASEETFQLNDRVPGPTTVVCSQADWLPPKTPLWAELPP